MAGSGALGAMISPGRYPDDSSLDPNSLFNFVGN